MKILFKMSETLRPREYSICKITHIVRMCFIHSYFILKDAIKKWTLFLEFGGWVAF